MKCGGEIRRSKREVKLGGVKQNCNNTVKVELEWFSTNVRDCGIRMMKKDEDLIINI